MRLSLTEKGDANHKEVIRLVFAFINKIKNMDLVEYFFRENKTMGQIAFDNQTRSDASATAKGFSHFLSQW